MNHPIPEPIDSETPSGASPAKSLALVEAPARVRGEVLDLRPPTGRQRLVLEFIHNHYVEHAASPTLREIGGAVGIKSTNGVNDHLRALERRGLIVRRDMVTRSIRVTVEGMLALGVNPENVAYVPGGIHNDSNATLVQVGLELKASRLENARLRFLLKRVLHASWPELPTITTDIRKELGE